MKRQKPDLQEQVIARKAYYFCPLTIEPLCTLSQVHNTLKGAQQFVDFLVVAL